jgi:hypothetical protein
MTADTQERVQHTPGPWVLRETASWMTGQVLFGHELPQREGEGFRSMRTVGWIALNGSLKNNNRRGTRKIPTEEDRANARLIAAAPELLEALRAALLDIENTAYDPNDGIASLARARLGRARAAIAKAEGRS